MSTSSSVNFTQTRSELVNDAFQIIGVYGVGRTISAADTAFANSTLNKMIKAWGAKGLHLWTKEENTLFLTKNQSSYDLGNGANACLTSDAVITQLNGALSASATTVVVDSTSGMTANDVIGIVLTDKSVHYTTISSVTNATTLQLTSGVSSAASDNANVYTFTTRMNKPLRILDCRRVQGIDSGNTTTQSEIIMSQIAYQDYNQLAAKTISGVPTQFAYNPKVSSTMLYLWQRPDSGDYRIQFTTERIIEDLDSAGDNFDLPNEWLEALTWQLALRLCPAFGKDQRMVNSIAPMATTMLDNLLDWDSENSAVSFMPDVD